ncbi:phosphatase PAP2 family protein [Georgenia subflava]|uniref:phosphatase PAP2 family protein n=1 Tax=Georgenia subflava TaxID=1622177 RepID=UPI00186B300C|nr:phosphatase PAP2 family protein [Georgenia subflava]
MPQTTGPDGHLSRDGASRAVALALAVLAGAAVVAVWWFFVTTATGQHVDEVAFEGATIGRWRLAESAQSVLDVVSVPFLVLVILVGVLVAVLRRRWLLAVAVGVMVGAANVTTQLLKYGLFTRPELGVSEIETNSLPSGHTTVAASVAAAAILVAPPRWRWLAALLGALYTGATGVATMVGGWHRASDVVAGVLVVTAWLLLAQAVVGTGGGARRGGARADAAAATGRAARTTRLTVHLLAIVGVGAGLVALLSMLVISQADGESRTELLLAYGGASVGVVGVTCLAVLAPLVLGTRELRR